MSPTSHFGTMVAGRKQQVEKGGGRRGESREGGRKGGVVEEPEEALCFIYHRYYVLAPLLEHKNTCGFKFLPSPYSLFPSFNSVPASLSYIIWLGLKDMNFPSIETSL